MIWTLLANPLRTFTIVAVGVLLLFSTYQQFRIMSLSARLSDAHSSIANLTGRLGTCSARLRNIEEGRRSDALVPDDPGSFVVPDDWLVH